MGKVQENGLFVDMELFDTRDAHPAAKQELFDICARHKYKHMAIQICGGRNPISGKTMKLAQIDSGVPIEAHPTEEAFAVRGWKQIKKESDLCKQVPKFSLFNYGETTYVFKISS